MRAELKLWLWLWQGQGQKIRSIGYLFIEDPEDPEGPPYFWAPGRRDPLARSAGWLVTKVRASGQAVTLEQAEMLYPGVTKALTARWPALINPYTDIDLGPDPEGGY